MYGYYGAQHGGHCPNCGAKPPHWRPKQRECDRCGYKIVPVKEEPPMTLIFCQQCHCHYSDGCPSHPS